MRPPSTRPTPALPPQTHPPKPSPRAPAALLLCLALAAAAAGTAAAARVCLVSVVKNESKQLPRMLKSISKHLSGYCICDTGSSDGTPDVVKRHFDQAGIRGHIAKHTWVNFAKNRNLCLKTAQEILNPNTPGCDFFLLLDADHEVKVNAKGWSFKNANLPMDGYMLTEGPGPGQTGALYENLRLVRAGKEWEYIGATHEYLHAANGQNFVKASLPPSDLQLIHHADGGSRSDKFQRDKRLLEQAAIEEPHDARTRFYLANTYRDLGNCTAAIEQYRVRTQLGGWYEEIYVSHVEIGKCFEELRDRDRAKEAYEAAWKWGDHRQEAPFYLARLAYRRDDNRACHRWARTAMMVGPAPHDALFTETYVYKHATADHICICSYYVDEISEGTAACHALISNAQSEIEAAAKAGAHASRDFYEVLQRSDGNLNFYNQVLEWQEAELEKRGGLGGLVADLGARYGGGGVGCFGACCPLLNLLLNLRITHPAAISVCRHQVHADLCR
jgi:glycosyltransferase involved in cell wall biosynthesis